jgi:hypothetical protein
MAPHAGVGAPAAAGAPPDGPARGEEALQVGRPGQREVGHHHCDPLVAPCEDRVDRRGERTFVDQNRCVEVDGARREHLGFVARRPDGREHVVGHCAGKHRPLVGVERVRQPGLRFAAGVGDDDTHGRSFVGSRKRGCETGGSSKGQPVETRDSENRVAATDQSPCQITSRPSKNVPS